jgi:hypothetical protein
MGSVEYLDCLAYLLWGRYSRFLRIHADKHTGGGALTGYTSAKNSIRAELT